ncbi:MAG: putative metal-binding motif-containing protein [Nitrospirae bacterium]|nr:putative metal-binding motif-containing protein [Nitrospirota bacterium]
MKKASIVSLCIAALAALFLWASNAGAYETYTASKGALNTNCAQCHGDYRTAPYNSQSDGQSWGGNLHDIHRYNMLSSNCEACHSGSSRYPVFIGTSAGGKGLAPVSCLGCHGRDEDNTNASTSGAGLRQHHYRAGETGCLDCHRDSNPANYKPVGENVLPPYYFTPDTSHPNKPSDSCNQSGEENFAGSANGLDNDGDGMYDGSDTDCQTAAACIDNDGDGYGSNGAATCPKGTAVDCNDNNAAINPGASEVCDSADNNCNGQMDEGMTTTYYRDGDGDGYGSAATSVKGCTAPAGYVANNTDCNDSDPIQRPNQTWYQDADNDGYSSGNMIVQCARPSAYKAASELKAISGDCSDGNAAINPGAVDKTCNGIDENCSGAADEGYAPANTTCGVGVCASTGQMICQGGKTVNTCTAGTPQTEGPVGSPTCSDALDNDCSGSTDAADPKCAAPASCMDNDGDGYGSNGAATCPKGTAVDCNDVYADINPGAAEICNGQDDNCNGQVDEGVKTTYYQDADGDGYGSPSDPAQSCTQPAGYVTNNSDCIDSNAAAHPGASDDNCNGVDENCSGTADEGYAPASTTCGIGICASTGQLICQGGKTVDTCTAGAPQTEGPVGSMTCGDTLDNDCNGLTDAAEPKCTNTAPACIDRDGDGYGSNGSPLCLNGTVIDCNDNNPKEHPGQTWYQDADNDRYSSGKTITQCKRPRGYKTASELKAISGDCNDRNPKMYPGAVEICGDHIDQNCNGIRDDNRCDESDDDEHDD